MQLINDPQDLVADSVAGLVSAHGDILTVSGTTTPVVSRAGGPTSGKVGLVSGGGSGHEPLHAGFVGVGMLDRSDERRVGIYSGVRTVETMSTILEQAI